MSILIQTPKNFINDEILKYHYDAIKQYNNNNQSIFIVPCIEQSLDLRYNWKNSDQELRDWWKNNKDNIKDDVIYITEYKMIFNNTLPTLSKDYDFVGNKIITEDISKRNQPLNKQDWRWWIETRHMLDFLNDQPAMGVISKGFYIIRKWVLDALCDEKYDLLYKKNIQNELRFATVAHLCGARIGKIDLLSSLILNPALTLNKDDVKEKINNRPRGGVGTELSSILEIFGFKITPNCKCKQRANIMNNNGIEWCENNKDKIIGWLEEEATSRHILFSKTIAKILLKRAIRNAKKKQNENNSTAT